MRVRLGECRRVATPWRRVSGAVDPVRGRAIPNTNTCRIAYTVSLRGRRFAG